VPNGKFDLNNGGLISTDCAGCSWRYPNASYDERRSIRQQHVDYQQGFLWALGHEPDIPQEVRLELADYGLCADEFTTNGNWPEQLYARETRRLVGDTVFVQNDIFDLVDYNGQSRSVGMGSYEFDGACTVIVGCV
jgi:hypothetical protein